MESRSSFRFVCSSFTSFFSSSRASSSPGVIPLMASHIFWICRLYLSSSLLRSSLRLSYFRFSSLTLSPSAATDSDSPAIWLVRSCKRASTSFFSEVMLSMVELLSSSRLAAFSSVAVFTSFTRDSTRVISVVSFSSSASSWVRACSSLVFCPSISSPRVAISCFRPSMVCSTACCFSCKEATCSSSLVTLPSSTLSAASSWLIFSDISNSLASNCLLVSSIWVWISRISSLLASIFRCSSLMRAFKSDFSCSSSVFNCSISSLFAVSPSAIACSRTVSCCSIKVTFSLRPSKLIIPLLI